jgi:gas vesicle protein
MPDEMKDERSGSAGALLIAFTLGAIAGAAVALLMAPATGRETREFLGEKAREGVRKAKNAYAEAAGDILGDES